MSQNGVTFGKFTAWISVGGKDGTILPVYQPVADPDTREVKCYIPSEQGVPFEVHWRDGGSGFDSAGYIYLDGQKAGGRFLRAGRNPETFRSGIRVGLKEEILFQFSQDISEDVANPISVEWTEHLGTIRLVIKRIDIVPNEGHPNRVREELPHARFDGARKGDHRITYHQAPRSYVEQCPVTFKFNSRGNYLTFIFIYMPLDKLKRMGIAPSEPSMLALNNVAHTSIQERLNGVVHDVQDSFESETEPSSSQLQSQSGSIVTNHSQDGSAFTPLSQSQSTQGSETLPLSPRFQDTKSLSDQPNHCTTLNITSRGGSSAVRAASRNTMLALTPSQMTPQSSIADLAAAANELSPPTPLAESGLSSTGKNQAQPSRTETLQRVPSSGRVPSSSRSFNAGRKLSRRQKLPGEGPVFRF